jgi:hypothetical protein
MITTTEFATSQTQESASFASGAFAWYPVQSPEWTGTSTSDIRLFGLVAQLDTLNALVERLRHLLDLPADWDSYGAVPVRADVVQQAAHLIRDWLTEGIPAPQIVPTPDGGVQLEWHQPAAYLEIHLSTPTDLSFYVESDGHEEEGTLATDRSRLASVLASLASSRSGG